MFLSFTIHHTHQGQEAGLSLSVFVIHYIMVASSAREHRQDSHATNKRSPSNNKPPTRGMSCAVKPTAECRRGTNLQPEPNKETPPRARVLAALKMHARYPCQDPKSNY